METTKVVHKGKPVRAEGQFVVRPNADYLRGKSEFPYYVGETSDGGTHASLREAYHVSFTGETKLVAATSYSVSHVCAGDGISSKDNTVFILTTDPVIWE